MMLLIVLRWFREGGLGSPRGTAFTSLVLERTGFISVISQNLCFKGLGEDKLFAILNFFYSLRY